MKTEKDRISYRRSNTTLNERILVQMTKLERLCREEGYNNETLNPSRNIIKELQINLPKIRFYCF